MKIVAITGTEIKGCTYHMKQHFLDALREDNDITEFYLPKDLPHFCTGCKVCFFKDEKLCPHAEYTMPIWNAILEADLLVFAAPVYVLRTPGQMKSLLDHFGCHWMVHRPDKAMFNKKAVILTNSIGAPNSSAQKDIATSLTWMGLSHIRRLGFGLMEGVIWNELSDKRRRKIENCTKNEVDTVIFWLTGYDAESLQKQIDTNVSFETFYNEAPYINPNAALIKGVVCGHRVEEIEDETMRNICYLDKLVDELAKGKSWFR